jgi:predicted RNA-binding Zn-ribbon protein involved in translation (DUF1610 family)
MDTSKRPKAGPMHFKPSRSRFRAGPERNVCRRTIYAEWHRTSGYNQTHVALKFAKVGHEITDCSRCGFQLIREQRLTDRGCQADVIAKNSSTHRCPRAGQTEVRVGRGG